MDTAIFYAIDDFCKGFKLRWRAPYIELTLSNMNTFTNRIKYSI
ncbi:hypothetical protein SAMN05421863_1001113 [Nitrosomonas communis]|uniref:Uncharacterized protein n=1 Tax=Nitrosomonas communis TaxID=44574 RepID=A0A1I4IYL2_9PROT|nr:hypothetical protein SAMN05421863_1001113 [Nitrosomonas communis]